MQKVEVIIIGAGAAGLMCAIEAGKRQRKVLVLDHANKAGKKILMSGGGRCNFTNLHIHPDHYLSHNPHFCKSALNRYTQWDFIALVERHKIAFHEKSLGQLFCDNKSKEILNMLLLECEQANVELRLNIQIFKIEKVDEKYFKIDTTQGDFLCQSVVIASGGLSIPTMGASPFGYKIAEQFNIRLFPTRAGLVPLTLHEKEKFSVLSGIAIDAIVKNDRQKFRENILFTHRGLSGPAILQISSYWHAGEKIMIDFLPEINLLSQLKIYKQQKPEKQLNSVLSDYLPKRFVDLILPEALLEKKLQSISYREIEEISQYINNWSIKPNGTEGYRTAEVTLGGVDCDALSSKTFEVNSVPGLYFIGEVLDVTGWLGGFNFQWAWSSGWAAGQVV
jgi:predicted Rossmann fold flavoprotein